MYKANKIESKEFNLNALKNRISEIRKMTLEDINDFLPKLKQFLSDAGVKFVYLPYLKGSNISGVTKWLPKEKAVMIAVNDCGKDAGKLWFSIFHELGHAIKNHKRHLTLSKEKDNIIDSDEIEANEFANNNLIDKNKYKEFIDQGDFSITSIKRFAKEQGIGDFIVIGRLQKDQIIEWDKYQQYKKRYEYNNCN